MTADPFLAAALRRIRFESALAVAEQRRDEASAVALGGKLVEARAVEDAARAAAGESLPMAVLTRRLGLRPIDETVLLAAVALELDPVFAVTACALLGEEPRHGVSPRLLALVLRVTGDEGMALRLDADHPLVEAGLLEPHGPTALSMPASLRPLRAPARVVSFLAGEAAATAPIDPLLRRCAEVVAVPLDLDVEHARGALDLLGRVLASGEDLVVCLEGIDGVGRRTLVAFAAAALGRPAVALDTARLSSEPQRFLAELRALRRECWLRGAVPIVARLDALSRREVQPGERFVDIAEALESPGAVHGPAVVTLTAGAELPDFRRRVVRVRLDPPGASSRERIWARMLAVPQAAPAVDDGLQAALREVGHRYAMTPRGIQRAAANARLFAVGRTPTIEDLHRGAAAEIQERFGGIATRVSVSQRWDDLVLPADTLDEVKAFAARASHAQLVYESWGFREKLQRGLGLAALFSGPPGTGKTMVAGLIARNLGLELYQIDLSQVVSKWVGETEKQLARVFEAASMGQALLLFDEADALFARRTEVKSSNDRYANLEVNFLLQRIEQFGGVAILTTNLESSVDPAFKRRLAADVRFYPPERAERERLWRTLIPSAAPTSADVDVARLADVYKEMCGGNIRNAVLRAAFLAASERTQITQQHMVRAARAEYRAMGKVI